MIQFHHLNFRYSDSGKGLTDICLRIQKGECVVLTGPSGNGKTTLTRLVNGLAPAYYVGQLSGSIEIGGEDRGGEPLWKRGRIVGSVFQDPKSQFFSSEMAGEVAFSCENYGLPQREIAVRTDAAIRRFQLEKFRDTPLDVLSSGEKQRTAAASVYAMDPPVYVYDEPTANLDEQGVKELREVLKSLKREGKTLLIAEHRLCWLMELADRIVYIEDGRLRWERTPGEMQELNPAQLEQLGLRTVQRLSPVKLAPPRGEGTPSVSLQGLSCRRGGRVIWENLNLRVYPGQIVAVTGENGAGKTTLARLIAGLERSCKGEICLCGQKAGGRQRRRKCWYSSNDTGTQFFTESVEEELLLGLQRTETVLKKAGELLRKLELYDYKDAHPAVLSGGQRQRLSIACGLLSGREVLLFDEPTSGLDGGNMQRIAEALTQAASEGKTVLIVTHDEELIQRCCGFRWQLGTVP